MSYLALHKTRPPTQLMDLTEVPVSYVTGGLKQFHALRNLAKEPELQVPETDAIWFYLTNAAMAKLSLMLDPYDPLGEFEWIVDDYYDRLKIKSLRMFYYLLKICTRESRHTTQTPKLKEIAAQYNSLDFHAKIIGSGSTNAVEMLIKYPPASSTLGEYTDHLVACFTYGSFGPSFGGKKWADIAKCLRAFVHGQVSAEVMLDTSFTLCHNNGPIFNKGMLYSHHNTSALLKILDIQRAGMIPEMISSLESPKVTVEHIEYQKKVNLQIPFAGAVDYSKVQQLGAVGHYKEKEKAIQGPVTLDIETKIKIKQSYESLYAAYIKKQGDLYHVMPGLIVQKVTKKRIKVAA